MDLLCRWSGEVLILQRPSATPHQALGDSERLRGRCRWIVWVTRHAITARFGVSRQGGHNPSSLVGAADRARYAMKEAGQDRDCMVPSGTGPVVIG